MGVRGFARSFAKSVFAGALHYSGMRGVLARASRVAVGGRRVLIVSFHRVVEDFEREAQQAIPGLLIGRRTFERQLEALHGSGFEVVPLGEALEVIAGRRQPKRDVAVVTFDDGYRDVWEHALPVLKRHGLPATVYLATAYVGTGQRLPHDRLFHLLKLGLAGARAGSRKNLVAGLSVAQRAAAIVDELIAQRPAASLMELVAQLEEGLGPAGELAPPSGELLTWEMARQLAAAGVEAGAHTARHVALTHESAEVIEREIAESKREIEVNLGRPVLDFAYPNGLYDARVVAALVRHGFRSAVTTEDLPNRVGGDLFRLRRKTLWEDHSRGPFGYSPLLAGCHLDDVFTALALTRPKPGERSVRASSNPADERGAQA